MLMELFERVRVILRTPEDDAPVYDFDEETDLSGISGLLQRFRLILRTKEDDI